MLTIVITAVIVTAAVAVLVFGRGRIRDRGGRGLKRRCGPEYDRAIADHDGDALRPLGLLRPLPPGLHGPRPSASCEEVRTLSGLATV
ncbi:hypothetical protein [Streptomyces avermitilis]|uniref:hypothetical protein n=1 Tax=Streptomyces avermitilis TaxID=33903 RepID=UPI0038188B6D